MVNILFKWVFVLLLSGASPFLGNHPIYVSVVEIEHNAFAKTLEISCKLFTDDFEKQLRNSYKVHVDLLDAKQKPAMEKMVNDYIRKHFNISVDGKPVVLNFLGYEQIEEGIVSYYEVANILKLKKISISNNLLYEYMDQQTGIIHVTVNGKRKSTKLVNPDDKVEMGF
ncbi:MAG: hypothetical protein IPO46_01575 [Chitinophagaceae bacterium]|jgi:hypothetical protein|nr:hypothetical protein [Chitinophagaceae bacterium]MBP6045757.1 hypothetical protein [Ferruginibacter sp.]NMD28923.1 hypothetical protein [Bacteroidota bacterium]MBK7346844.1 hypothetical protein [Chitinophagaceae bacterium]MBK7735238.1 hypothetical protein [Chitinophagaceae bacterium]